MRWSKLLSALALCMVASALAVQGLPITDRSITTMNVLPGEVTPYGDETFIVSVQRIDDLIDDDGSLIAERIMSVKLDFDVNDTDILISGTPVNLGVSTIRVQTGILASPLAVSAGLTPADLKPAFDIGLVTMKVKAQAEEVLLDATELAAAAEEMHMKTADIPEFIKVRRIVVTARILEINDHEIALSNLVEQVIDIMPSGAVHHGAPKALPMLATGMPGIANFPEAFDVEELAQQEQRIAPCHRGVHPLAQHAARAWHRLPLAVRIGLAAFFGSLLLLTVFVALPFAMYAQWRARRDPAYRALDADDTASFDFAVDEKKVGDIKDPQLLDPPAYQETDALVSAAAKDDDH